MEPIFEEVKQLLDSHEIRIVDNDLERPWGGFYVIDESIAQKFSDVFFEGLNVEDLKLAGKLSPKILMVKPHARLSWQYHNRRAEIWRVIKGKPGVMRSESNEETEVIELNTFDKIILKQGERHRLIGLNDWAVIAEIWQHTDNNFPSDENDIVRVQDDFGR